RVHRLCTRVVSRAPVLIQRFFAPVLLRPPRSAHFPYTTLFRSVVRIPRVFDELTTSQVLTEQRARGLRITAAAALDAAGVDRPRSEEHTSELQSRFELVCRLLLEKKKDKAC